MSNPWMNASAVWPNAFEHSNLSSISLGMSTVGKPCPPVMPQDPRHQGWPCNGMHTPGPMRQNKYAKWHACKRCGLRLSYTTKSTYQGETRAIGPEPQYVEAAQQELKAQYAPANMNQKIFNGKLMELRGRGLVQTGGAGRTTVQVRADEPLGKYLMAGYNMDDRGMGSTTTPSTTTQTQPNAEVIDPAPTTPPPTPTPKAEAKAKTAPRVKREPTTPVAKAAPKAAPQIPPEEVLIEPLVDEVLTIMSSEED